MSLTYPEVIESLADGGGPRDITPDNVYGYLTSEDVKAWLEHEASLMSWNQVFVGLIQRLPAEFCKEFLMTRVLAWRWQIPMFMAAAKEIAYDAERLREKRCEHLPLGYRRALGKAPATKVKTP